MPHDEEISDLMRDFLAVTKGINKAQEVGRKDRERLHDRLSDLTERLTALETKINLAFGTNGGGVLQWDKRVTTLENDAKASAQADILTDQNIKDVSRKVSLIYSLLATVVTNILWLVGQWLSHLTKGP